MEFTYPRDIRFQCVRCTQCCGDTKTHTRHILLLEAEAQNISKATLKPIEHFAIKTKDCEPYLYEIKKKVNNGKCVFLSGNSCTIYNFRPLICRFYPFQLKPAKDDRYEFSYTKECKGIGNGARLGKKYFTQLLCQLQGSWKSISNTCSLSSQNVKKRTER